MREARRKGGRPRAESGLSAPEAPAARGIRLTGGMLAVFAALFLLTGIIRIFAGSAALLGREMARWAPPERTGLPAEAYGPLAERIAGYLTGRTEELQLELPGPDGERTACFHDYELIHMADCRGLIRLDGIVCVLCFAGAAGCALRLIRRERTERRAVREEAWRGMKTALRMMGLFAAAMVLWAAADFDGLFVTFHRAAFRNDYWLLNPRTDLLIRLMPTEMFADLGLRGLGCFAAGLGLFCAGAYLRLGREHVSREGRRP